MNKCLYWPQWNVVGLALFGLLSAELKADTWDVPRDSMHQSGNSQFQFSVAIGDPPGRKRPTGTLRRKAGENWEIVWTNQLVNQVSPVQVMVPDSGRHVVTFDEYHAVGESPVVIYGEKGQLIAKATLADLNLVVNHPKISRSASSYRWNEAAIMVFGPTRAGDEPGHQQLEDSLFIRLYWGDVISIDLASGRVRDTAWWESIPKGRVKELKQATDDYLDKTWRRLARDYFRKDNFEPYPTAAGIKGLLLIGQLRLREGLPLARELAATERSRDWSAPRWKTAESGNVQELARTVITEIE